MSSNESCLHRFFAACVFAGGCGAAIWLVACGWNDPAVAKGSVPAALGFVVGVAVFRVIAWLRPPTRGGEGGSSDGAPAVEPMVDTMLRTDRFGRWWRAPITVGVGGSERTTTLLGTTPLERSLTRLALVALVAAWILAGRMGWVWFPTPRTGPRPSIIRKLLGMDP